MNEEQLTEEEQLALEYIRKNPGSTAEDVIEWFSPSPDDIEYRATIANAVAKLWAHKYVIRDPRTNALTAHV